MARRMIHARRASPYLLYLVIAFAILTVAGWAGFGWMYSARDEVLQRALGSQRVEAAQDVTELWRDILDRYNEANNLVDVIEAKKEQANVYQKDIQRLAERLAGDPFTSQAGTELRQSVSDVLKATNDLLIQTEQELQQSYTLGDQAPPADIRPTSMVTAIRGLVQRINALGQQIQEDKKTIANLETQIEGVRGELDAAKVEHKRQVAQVQQELADEKDRLTKSKVSAEDMAKRLDEDKDKLQDRLLVDRRKYEDEIKKLRNDINKLQNHLKDLSGVVKEFREVPTETGVDGRIVSVAGQGGEVAYADLGEDDGILLGMTFSVFSPSELGKTEPQPKANCRVVKIMGNSCELRIYEIMGDNPVVSGDVLHNPVYDRQRRMRFVLKGSMDMDGDGFDDSEELKALIQEFGGRIDAELTVQADFLILGEEPEVPAPPDPGDGPQKQQAYRDARKRFIDYTEARARAENFSIPILNLNRFLGLVGVAGQT